VKIVLDQNGNPIDELKIRNEAIRQTLEPVLNEFLKERDASAYAKRPPKLGYRFTKQIYLVLAGYGQMSAEKFVSLDYDDIHAYWLKYLELTAYYNRYFEIVDNKQLLCAFMGINTRQYTELEKSEDEDIRALMNSINSTFVGLGFVATESGNADSRAVNARLRANGEAGHSVITATEDKIINNSEAVSEVELTRQLDAILGRKLLKK
jgi:hypothetical protein